MANWTVQPNTTAQAAGATGTQTLDLTIVPNAGFVISASNFKIGGASTSGSNIWTGGNVDSGISQVQFIDTGTAGTQSNTVTARVTYSFTMPSANKTIKIDIDEISPTTNVNRFICMRSQHFAETDENANNKHTVTTTSETGITQTNNSSGITNGIVDHTHQGTVVQGTAHPGSLLFTKTFTANTTNGYYYDAVPTFSFNFGGNDYSSYYNVFSPTVTLDADGNITEVVFTVYYEPPVGLLGFDPDPASSASSMCELGHVITFNHVLRQNRSQEPGNKPKITDFIIDQSPIDPNGETRTLQIQGEPFAQYSITIVSSDSSKTYDFLNNPSPAAGSFTAAATTSSTGSALGYDQLGTVGAPVATINFPAVTSNTTYEFFVTPQPTTTTDPGVPIASNKLTISQFVNVNVSLGFDDSASEFNDGTLPTPVSLETRAAQTYGDKPLTRRFEYTITPAMTNSGSSAITPNSTPDFTLDTLANIQLTVSGDPTGTSFDITGSTAGVKDGSVISISTTKVVSTDVRNSSVVRLKNNITDTVLNSDDIIEGNKMIVTGSGISGDPLVDSNDGNGQINLTDPVNLTAGTTLTFTTQQELTVSSVTDSNTIVANSSMAGIKSGKQITLATGSNDVVAHIPDGEIAQDSANVKIAGTLHLTQAPTSDKTVRLDLDKLIDI
tara:strand:- start:215 stop:2224 length:2010 start_codon:yes stop_codon:yes gene_type:complete